jgi:hypothetical protein
MLSHLDSGNSSSARPDSMFELHQLIGLAGVAVYLAVLAWRDWKLGKGGRT